MLVFYVHMTINLICINHYQPIRAEKEYYSLEGIFIFDQIVLYKNRIVNHATQSDLLACDCDVCIKNC